MFKKKIVLTVFLFLAFFSIKAQEKDAEFLQKIIQSRTNDNLEAYYYHYIDYYVSHKTILSPQFLEEAIKNEWRTPKTKKEQIAKLHLLINEAYYLKERGKIKESISIYEKALKIYQQHNLTTYRIISYCLKPLANNYTRIGDYKRADELFKYTISIAKQKKNQKELIATYLNLSIKYQSLGNIKKAIALLREAIDLKPKKKQLSSLYSQLAKNELLLKHYNTAYKVVLKSEKLDVDSKNKITNNATLSKYYIFKKEYEKALNLLFENLKQKSSKRRKAKTFIEIASVFSLNHKYKKSLLYLNQALTTLLPSYKPNTIFDIPKKHFFYAENTIKEALDAKGLILEKMKKYDLAIAHYQSSFAVENLLRNSYLSQKAKLIQQSENRKRSEKIIALYDVLYQRKPSDSILFHMIKVMEHAKATVLSSVLTKQTKYASIKNDSLYIAYLQLQKDIAFYDSKIQTESLKTHPNIDFLAELNKKKTELNTNYTVLNAKIQDRYPFLKQLDYNIDFKETIKSLLHKKQYIFYFFNTKSNLYVFRLGNHITSYKKIKKTNSYNDILQNYVSFFSDGNPNKIDNHISNYKNTAYNLYNLFFDKEDLKDDDLIIIPDQLLNFVPFDALLTKRASSNNYEKLPYFVRQSRISYGYSLTVLTQLQKLKKRKKRKKLIAFFPVFKNNYLNLNELKFTKEEKKTIAKYYDGTFLEGKKATKKAFLKKAANYDIIHISTHADGGDFKHPAKIEFYDAPLSLLEVYGLHFNSNLMVLSACETGIGKLEKGEGVMSLSRGFSYAGIPNLVVSQWKVNDKSTGILMGNFYKNLKNSNAISFSLQQAKKDYLDSTDINVYKKNPYYWAGFIFVGAVPNSHHSLNWIYAIGLIFLIFLVFILYKVKKNI